MGWAELASYAIFHDYTYYSLATQQEEEGADFRPMLASAVTATPPASPTNAAAAGGSSGSEGDAPPRIVSGSGGTRPPATAASGSGGGGKAGTWKLFGGFGGPALDEADVEAIADANHL